MKLCKLVVLTLAAGALTGCAAPPVWRDYDKCAKEISDFVSMVRCGKMERETMLSKYPLYGASDVGNAFEQYADALAAQVESKQITEADAWARFAEYKTKLISDQQRNAAIAAAAAPPVVVQQAPVVVPPPVVLPPTFDLPLRDPKGLPPGSLRLLRMSSMKVIRPPLHRATNDPETDFPVAPTTKRGSLSPRLLLLLKARYHSE